MYNPGKPIHPKSGSLPSEGSQPNPPRTETIMLRKKTRGRIDARESRYDLPSMSPVPLYRCRCRRNHRFRRPRHQISPFIPRPFPSIRGRERARRIEELEIRRKRAAAPCGVQVQNLTGRHDAGHVGSCRIPYGVVEVLVGGSDSGRRAGEVREVEDLRRSRGTGDGREIAGPHGEDCGCVGGADACVGVSCREVFDHDVDTRGDGVGDFSWEWWGAGACVAICIRWSRGLKIVNVYFASED